jgi:single-strand selective monofunctional uracil DNA glycosylase
LGAEVAPLIAISRRLCTRVGRLSFADPVKYTYNPLAYARAPHEAYLGRYGIGPKEVILLGMNPGPFGMAQTGVPFGDVSMVRDWLGIEGRVGKPTAEHEKRLVTGFACSRQEVSGQRLWGWAKNRFVNAEHFFERFFVINYCPLAFLEASGKNRTPDHLPKAERAELFAACDEALRQAVEVCEARHVVGVGAFAEARAHSALGQSASSPGGVRISTILHPSPASPKANQGWAAAIEGQLRAAGIALPT